MKFLARSVSIHPNPVHMLLTGVTILFSAFSATACLAATSTQLSVFKHYFPFSHNSFSLSTPGRIPEAGAAIVLLHTQLIAQHISMRFLCHLPVDEPCKQLSHTCLFSGAPMSYLAIFAMLKSILFSFTLACLICFLSPMLVTFFHIRLKIGPGGDGTRL